MCENDVSYLIHCKRFIPPGEQVAENRSLLLAILYNFVFHYLWHLNFLKWLF